MSQEQPNLDYIDRLSGDDEAFKQKFLAILKGEFPEEQKEYMESLQSGDAKKTALIVHKLKHKFNILSLYQGYEIAVDYEKALHTGDFSMHPIFINILDRIESYLKTI